MKKETKRKIKAYVQDYIHAYLADVDQLAYDVAQNGVEAAARQMRDALELDIYDRDPEADNTTRDYISDMLDMCKSTIKAKYVMAAS